jgi:hypothetical protein
MHSPRIFILFLILLPALAGTAGATYAGDNPLNSTYFDDIKGTYVFDMGNSRYEGSVAQGDVYNVTYSISLPADANVTFQRLYLYWSWSRIGQKAVYPGFVVYESHQPDIPLTRVSRYTDSKGFVSQYDFYSGLDVYEIPRLQPGRNNFSVTCVQAGMPNSSVIIFGIGVLAVYDEGGFRTYKGSIDRYPDKGETVDLYAAIETIPPTKSQKTPLSPLAAVPAVAAAALLVKGRRT